MTSNIQEKRLWVNSLASCLRKEANFNIASIVELGQYVDKNLALNCILRQLPNISPPSLSSDTRRSEEKLTGSLRTLIAAFVGNIVSVTKLSLVSRAWNEVLKLHRHDGSTQKNIFSWLIRYGEGLTQDIHRW